MVAIERERQEKRRREDESRHIFANVYLVNLSNQGVKFVVLARIFPAIDVIVIH